MCTPEVDSFLVVKKTRGRLADLIFTVTVALPELSEVGQNETDIISLGGFAKGGSSHRDRMYCADLVTWTYAQSANIFRSEITTTAIHFYLHARIFNSNTS